MVTEIPAILQPAGTLASLFKHSNLSQHVEADHAQAVGSIT